MHAQHLLVAGVTELSVLWSLNADEHHECAGEEHAVFAFDSDGLSEIFSQATRETFDRIIIVLLVTCVAVWSHATVIPFHALDGEQRA